VKVDVLEPFFVEIIVNKSHQNDIFSFDKAILIFRNSCSQITPGIGWMADVRAYLQVISMLLRKGMVDFI
jgi:hypothetical protein